MEITATCHYFQTIFTNKGSYSETAYGQLGGRDQDPELLPRLSYGEYRAHGIQGGQHDPPGAGLYLPV